MITIGAISLAITGFHHRSEDYNHVAMLENKVKSLMEQTLYLNNSFKNITDEYSMRMIDLTSNISNMQSNFSTMIQTYLNQTSKQFKRLQDQILTTQNDIACIKGNVTSLQEKESATWTNVSRLSTHLTDVQNEVSRTSDIVTDIIQHLITPVNLYWYCHKETVSCSVKKPTTDNKRLLCNTQTLPENKKVCQFPFVLEFRAMAFPLLSTQTL